MISDSGAYWGRQSGSAILQGIQPLFPISFVRHHGGFPKFSDSVSIALPCFTVSLTGEKRLVWWDQFFVLICSLNIFGIFCSLTCKMLSYLRPLRALGASRWARQVIVRKKLAPEAAGVEVRH